MIIGITGTNGAGKGTVVDYLIKTKGFKHFSARGFIAEELERRGLPVNRDNTRTIGNELRKLHGPDYLSEQLFNRAHAAGGNAVIESIRNVGEAKHLQTQGALLWAVDADRKARYERSVLRASDLDKISYEKFCEQEDKEMAQVAPHEMNVFGVMAIADSIFTNNGTLGDLYSQVEEALEKSR